MTMTTKTRNAKVAQLLTGYNKDGYFSFATCSGVRLWRKRICAIKIIAHTQRAPDVATLVT